MIHLRPFIARHIVQPESGEISFVHVLTGTVLGEVAWDPSKAPSVGNPKGVRLSVVWLYVQFLEIFRCLAPATAHVWALHSNRSAGSH